MCDFIYKIIHYLIVRIMMLFIIFMAPLFFLMEGGGCANAKKQTLAYIKNSWDMLK